MPSALFCTPSSSFASCSQRTLTKHTQEVLHSTLGKHLSFCSPAHPAQADALTRVGETKVCSLELCSTQRLSARVLRLLCCFCLGLNRLLKSPEPTKSEVHLCTDGRSEYVQHCSIECYWASQFETIEVRPCLREIPLSISSSLCLTRL